jgi:hypothetical protein
VGKQEEENKELAKSKSGGSSVLERLRISKKEAKLLHQQHFTSLKEGTFIVPPFKALGYGNSNQDYSTISSTGFTLDDCGDENSGT